jgi:hypothetical protein
MKLKKKYKTTKNTLYTKKIKKLKKNEDRKKKVRMNFFYLNGVDNGIMN